MACGRRRDRARESQHVKEHEVERIGAFEHRMKDYATNQPFRDKLKGYTDLYITGTREILQIA